MAVVVDVLEAKDVVMFPATSVSAPTALSVLWT